MRIIQVPILEDNYSYLVADDARGVAAAVDPADPGPVEKAVAEHGLKLTHVLCTHHHWDHSGGNEALKSRHPDLEVLGSRTDAPKIPALTTALDAGDQVTVGGLTGEVLAVPCHTRGHVAFRFGDALFCGDTLFVAGCGRFFEGDAAEMHHALNEIFGGLPPETRVYCGHEYTVGNLKFALAVEPDNADAQRKLAWAQAERAAGRSTVPSTLGEERTYNPFLRVREPTVQKAVGQTDPVEVMAALRRWKNEFKA